MALVEKLKRRDQVRGIPSGCKVKILRKLAGKVHHPHKIFFREDQQGLAWDQKRSRSHERGSKHQQQKNTDFSAEKDQKGDEKRVGPENKVIF